MISSVFGGLEEGFGTRGARRVGAAVREGYKLCEGIGSVGTL